MAAACAAADCDEDDCFDDELDDCCWLVDGDEVSLDLRDLFELWLLEPCPVPDDDPTPLARAAAVDGSKLAAAITAAKLCASMPAKPPRAAKFPKRFMLFMLPMFAIDPRPGMPAKGIIDDNGFFGSKAPSPGKLESKLAFNPARPGKFAMLAAAELELCDDCFLLEDDVDVDDPPWLELY